MKKKYKIGFIIGIVIAAVVVVTVFALILVLDIFNIFSGSSAVNFEATLTSWVSEWKSGDDSSFSDGLSFGDAMEQKPSSDDEGALAREQLKAMMESDYAGLIETPKEHEPDSVFPILMAHTDVTYVLTQREEAPPVVTFTVVGPDMANIVSQMDSSGSRDALMRELDKILSSSSFETRTVTIDCEIIELKDGGFKLDGAEKLIDALYGGMISVLAESLPSMGEN